MMNWVGNLVQKEVDKKDTVLYVGCGIMQDVGDVNHADTWLVCKYIIGVDIFRPYLECIKNIDNITVINHDIRDLQMFLDRSFDVVIALDVVEHLEEKDSYNLISEMERIARKKVIIFTPCKFESNIDSAEGRVETGSYSGFGQNTYQLHRCLITFEWLRNNGYDTRKVSANKDNLNIYSFAIKVVK